MYNETKYKGKQHFVWTAGNINRPCKVCLEINGKQVTKMTEKGSSIKITEIINNWKLLL